MVLATTSMLCALILLIVLSYPTVAFRPSSRVRAASYQRQLPTLTEPSSSVTANARIIPVELNDELKSSFMSYAVSTILGRALPDARDGLKPVHRRVLYAMQVLNLLPESGYRKCARIVGEVLGKYHPHGDQSVYDALVRMAQDFVMLHPLVTGHGNFGSVDNDPPAAMRYTEARLSPLAYDSLLTDIKEDSVDFSPNFDGNEEEPAVLPARLPLLLLNGASGIAVGMATNIPPHNLGELCDAIAELIDNPSLSDEVTTYPDGNLFCVLLFL
jgi:DNA gyrase subunit A